MNTKNSTENFDFVETINNSNIKEEQINIDSENSVIPGTIDQDVANHNNQSPVNISEMIANTVQAVDMSHQSEQNHEPIDKSKENLSKMTNSPKLQEYPVSKLIEKIPTIDDKGFKALEQDIITFGLRQPITIYNNEIIDGRARYRICTQHGIEPDYSTLEIENTQIKSWIESCHINHKDMTPSQRALLAALNKEDFEKQLKITKNEAKRAKEKIPEYQDTARMCCKHYGASYGMYVKAMKLVEKKDKKTQLLVEQGKINLDTALKLIGNSEADKVVNFLYEKEIEPTVATRILAIKSEDPELYKRLLKNKTAEAISEDLAKYSFKKNNSEIYQLVENGEITLMEARKKRSDVNKGKKELENEIKSRTLTLPETTSDYINRMALKAGIAKEEFILNIIEFYKENTKNTDEVNNG